MVDLIMFICDIPIIDDCVLQFIVTTTYLM